MQERRWLLHNRQVGLRRVWRSVLHCCCGQHQDENLDMEALIVILVSETLIYLAFLMKSVLSYSCLLFAY